MSNLTLNLTQTQADQIKSFFDGLTGAGGLSSADYSAAADALEFGTLEEVSLSSTRYEVNLFGVGHVAQGAVIYSGSGFQTSGWDGNPLTLTSGAIEVGSVINSIEIRNAAGHALFVLRGGLSGIEMIGGETTAGSFNLTELQLGSQEAGTQILITGNLNAALTSPNLTVNGSINEVSLYVRNGTEAYQFSLAGALTPSASLMEQLNGDITTLSSSLDGEVNGLSFTRITYADAGSQTPTGTQVILDASSLHLTPEDLGALESAATHGLGPDISFSLDGQAVTDIGTGSNDRATYIAVQADGKILVTGFTNQYGSDPQLDVVRYNSDGTLDTSFAGDGKFSSFFPSGTGGANWAGVGQQADGKINVVALHNSNDMVHLRLNTDGSLDTSLDGDGISQISLGALGLGFGNNAKSLADGKELVAFSNGFKLAQFNTDGSLDTGFGGGDGITEIPLSGSAMRIALQADGSILVAGTTDNQMTLARFTAAGVLDTTFNNGSGYAIASIGTSSYANGIAVQADGKIVVGGGSYNGSNNDFAIARFNADGTLDTSFSYDGLLTHDAGSALGMGSGWDSPYSLLIDTNGDILMTGMRFPSQPGQDPVYVVSRFGSDGWHKETLTTELGPGDLPANAVLQSDGALLVAGTAGGDFSVTRLLPAKTAIDQILLSGDDTLTMNTDVGVDVWGYQGNDTLTAGAGNDRLFGGAGNDILNGGLGSDWASYKSAGGAVTVNLASGTASGAAGSDTLISVENIQGSDLADALTGNDGENYLRGNGGDDTLDGGAGTDWADYKNAAGAVSVSLVTNTASGADGNDTLISIEFVRGSNFDDTLTGNSSGNTLRGGGGNDSLDGGAGSDWVSYWDAPGAVTVSLTSNTASGADGIDTLTSIENITASQYADTLTGNGAENYLRGSLGDDTLDGGAGSDWADYINAPGAVSVSLATNTASGADGNDILISIEYVRGSNFDDTLTGNSDGNTLRGGGGNDSLDGGAGSDWVSYWDAPGAVTVSLSNNTASGADGTDTLTSIENITASQYADTLTGNGAESYLRGNLGDDTLDGGAGTDWADYQNAPGAVSVSLVTNTASGADGNDTLISIEFVRGSKFDDTLTGNSSGNALRGGGGNDSLDGGAGSDWVSYWDASGAVTVSLASNSSSGADGIDTLTSIENITASQHADDLIGNSAGNTLRGNRGNDTLNGGDGFDYADYWYASGAVTASLATNTSSGADGNDTLIAIEALSGSGFADTLTGNEFDNWIMGNGGNDSVDGGIGADGASYFYASGAVIVSLATSTSSGADGNDTLIGIEKLSGSGFDDALTGDSGSNWLWGNGGNDTLEGGNGADGASYSNASGGVTVSLVTNTASGADGNDTLIGIEMLNGSTFADSLTGDAGANSLWGMSGNDILNGGRGSDLMDGGSGNDLYVVDNLYDHVNEMAGGGIDSISAKLSHTLTDNVENLFLTGSVTVRSGGFFSRKTTTFDLNSDGTGNASDNLLRGNRGHNALDGLGGNDTLLGGAGADVLQGGTGADRLLGGAGADSFVFAAGDGGASLAAADMLYDFEDGIDMIGLAGGLDYADLTISQGNGIDTATGNTVIGTSSNEYLVVLLHTSASAITALDFQLLGV